MTRLLGMISGVLMVAGLAAHADEPPVVVELYTSQGCSSCPPADAFMHELANRDDVIALALHVDYWDYIGWKDSFASPDNTMRQKAYAAANNRRSVYTPQMIIDGQDHVVGNQPSNVTKLINNHLGRSQTVQLSLDRVGNSLRINAKALRPFTSPLSVQLVRYQPKATVDIRRGENAGKRISYAHIVTEWHELKSWHAQSPLSIKTRVSGDEPVVVLIQRFGMGPIEAAAELR